MKLNDTIMLENAYSQIYNQKDEVAAQKIAEKIQGTPNLTMPTLKQYVKKYLPMVGKTETDEPFITSLVYDILISKGFMQEIK
jgi:hypothetical protein